MKRIVIVVAVLFMLLFGWRYVSPLRVADPQLQSFNSNQACAVPADCGRGGCNGEICGSGGITVCYPDPKLARKLMGKQCSCIRNSCQWSKPLIIGL